MTIKDWPNNERPRERLLTRGTDALSDAELLAVCLGSGTRGCTAVDLGRDLLHQAGGLRALLGAEMPRVRGLGVAKRARLVAALELARRCLAEDLIRPDSLGSPHDSAEFLHARLTGCSVEVFACVFLDNRHRVIAFEELFRGTLDGAHVHAREVVRACLKHNAAAVIFAHNHPSGVAEPSETDRAVTVELRRALALVGVRVLDHFVIGSGRPVSLAQRGMM